MANDIQTFGDYLHQFVLTIDIVDKQTLNDFMGTIEAYVKDLLKINYMSIKWKTQIDDSIGLRTVSGDDKDAVFVLEKNGEISGQAAYVFSKEKPIWVVDENKQELSLANSRHIDLWRNSDDIPQRPQHRYDESKTLIILPITRGSQTFGVLEFETKKYIEPTDIAMKELQKISDTIARARYLNEIYNSQRENTSSAIRRLQTLQREYKWPALTKPQIFVAFSSNANKEVTGHIRKVLDEYSNQVDIVCWDEINEAGNIDKQIIETITKSRFGVCYFSEPAPDGDSDNHKFIDNVNVIFEAGMFQSLTNSPNVVPVGWIPIREKESPPPPFDFGKERIVEIPRLADGKLNQDLFIEIFNGRVTNLLEKIT